MEKHSTFAKSYVFILGIGMILSLMYTFAGEYLYGFSQVFFVWSMCCIGMMHGMGDLDEIKNNHPTWTYTTIIIIYSILMILTAIGRFIAPFVVVVIFVGVAAYHFGKDHRADAKTTTNSGLFYVLRGLSLLIPLILFDSDFSYELVYPLIQSNIFGGGYGLFVYFLLVGVWAMRLLISILISGKRHGYVDAVIEIFMIGLVGYIAWIGDFYIAFGFAFGLIHSLPQLIDMDTQSWGQIGRQYLSWIRSYRYMIVATCALYGVRYVISSTLLYISPSMVFLTFLSIVAIPHITLEIFDTHST